MRRLVLGALVALVIPATADAMAPTQSHRRAYEHAYHQVAHRFGSRTPGRNIVRDGTARGRASDAQVVASIAVLHRMLAPAPPAPPELATISTATHPTFVAAAPPGLDGLAQCVERNESGGNPQATNGQYHGVGQWSASAWAQDGGTRYGPDPLDATKAEQEAVLGSESDATLRQQQGQYDGCG